jgi:hypothetical protein
MNVEAALSRDFAALVDRLRADNFADRIIAKLRGVERLRVVAVGAAGATGAALAASQFGALTQVFSAMPTTSADLAFDAAPMALAALAFALVGGATALIAPGAR